MLIPEEIIDVKLQLKYAGHKRTNWHTHEKTTVLAASTSVNSENAQDTA